MLSHQGFLFIEQKPEKVLINTVKILGIIEILRILKSVYKIIEIIG